MAGGLYWFIGKFKKWPIKVTIFKKYQNTLRPIYSKGRYEKTVIRTENGMLEAHYLVLFNERKRVPSPDISMYQEIEGGLYLNMIQLDRWTYYPLTFVNDKMIMHSKQPLMDKETGLQVVGADGLPAFLKVETPIFDSSVMLEDGRTIPVPTLLTVKTYDKEQWLAKEIEHAQRFFRNKGLWEKFGSLIVMGVIIIAIIAVAYLFMSNYAKMNKDNLEANKVVAEALKEVSINLKASVEASKGTASNPIRTPAPPY